MRSDPTHRARPPSAQAATPAPGPRPGRLAAAASTRVRTAHTIDHTYVLDATLEALALVEICRRAMAVDLDSTRAPLTDMTVVINAEDPDTIHTPDGTCLADGTSRYLLCDPRLRPVVTTRLGVPLDLGRDARFATLAQRRAMAIRDGGCVFPGCTNPATWTEAHHLDQWRHNGNTDITRMASLCRHHHQVVHRDGWHMHAEPHGTFWFATPGGRTFWGQQHGHQTQGPTPDTS